MLLLDTRPPNSESSAQAPGELSLPCWCPTYSEAPLQPLAFLRVILLASGDDQILRQARQQVKRPNHGSVLLPQHDFIPSPKDFDLLAFQSKLLRQAYGLTVSGPEYSCRAHANLHNVYTLGINTVPLVF